MDEYYQKNYSKITKKIDHEFVTPPETGVNVSILHTNPLNHATPSCMKSS